MLIRLLLLLVRIVARLLLFILLAVVGVIVWRKFKRQIMQHTERTQSGERVPERVVSCAYCQVHVPESEAVRAEERYFCGVEHRDAFRRNAA